ncbi:hypothetical protein MTX20_37675 [Bradyrhizobium sp. ISRA435]|nr:hypothetical protein MTX20_37675 [Bradyrhizobium sp. ISRA435]
MHGKSCHGLIDIVLPSPQTRERLIANAWSKAAHPVTVEIGIEQSNRPTISRIAVEVDTVLAKMNRDLENLLTK